jgi:hypothetical protein
MYVSTHISTVICSYKLTSVQYVKWQKNSPLQTYVMSPRNIWLAQRDNRCIIPLILNLGARCGWQTPSPRRFNPAKNPVPIIEESGKALVSFWMFVKKSFFRHRVWTPDCPACVKSLHLLHYPGLLQHSYCITYNTTFLSFSPSCGNYFLQSKDRIQTTGIILHVIYQIMH